MILLGTGREDTPGKTLDTKELEDSKAFIASRHGSNCGKKTMDLSAFFFPLYWFGGWRGLPFFVSSFYLSFFLLSLPPAFFFCLLSLFGFSLF